MKYSGFKTVLALLSGVLAFNSSAAHADYVKQLPVSQIHPTQPAIGYDEVKLKIAELKQDRKKLFDEFCKNNGAGKVASFDAKSDITVAKSFQCADAWGSHLAEVKSAVLAPDHQVYLTDGHHTISVFRDFSGDKDFPYYVRITDDLSKLPNMQAFWETMQQKNLAWLNDPQGKAVKPEDLPKQVGMKYMPNDDYRSVVYFLRGVAYKKMDDAPPFLEFYLGSWLRTHAPAKTDALKTEAGYAAYLSEAAQALTAADGTQHATEDAKSPTLEQLGKLDSVKSKKLKKLTKEDGKLTKLFSDKA